MKLTKKNVIIAIAAVVAVLLIIGLLKGIIKFVLSIAILAGLGSWPQIQLSLMTGTHSAANCVFRKILLFAGFALASLKRQFDSLYFELESVLISFLHRRPPTVSAVSQNPCR